MQKKILSVLIAIVMILAIAPLSVFAEDDISVYLYYEIIDGEVTVSGCNESINGDFLIPGTIEGYPVTKIADDAFSGYKDLKSISIPDSVTEIGNDAFSDCESLESVVIPNGVTKIEDRAFMGCRKLKNISIPGSVTEIANGTFADCESLETVVISDGVAKICNGAFQGCISLKNVTISSSVTEIEATAFYYCTALENIVIPAGVESIGVEAFSLCLNLKSIEVDENNKYFSSSKDGVLFNKDKTAIILYPIGNSRTEYSIPDSVRSIEFAAFYFAKNLKNITIPDSVETIGGGAFAGCYRLEEIVIPDSVTSTIGEQTFVSCINLKTVIIGNGVTGIEENAFSDCPVIENVTIGENVEFIGEQAFASELGNIAMKKITIPENVTRIDKGAFYFCNYLKEINIYNPEMVIAENSFYKAGILDRDTYSRLVIDIYENRTKLDGLDQDLENKLVSELLAIVYQIPDDELKDAVIYGYTGSTAEIYATENNMMFKELGEKITPDEEEDTTVPEIPKDDEEADSETDFIGMIIKMFEKIIDFFTKIFSSLMNLFA